MSLKRPLTMMAAAIMALTLGALGAGCGSSKEATTTTTASASATAAWADGVCTAIATWETTLRATAEDLKTGGVTKSAALDAANTVQSATAALVDDIRHLGAPGTQSGEKAKKTVDELAASLQTSVDRMKATVDKASGVAGVLSAVSVVGSTLVSMRDDLTGAVDRLESLDATGELHDAFAQSASCQEIRGGTQQ